MNDAAVRGLEEEVDVAERRFAGQRRISMASQCAGETSGETVFSMGKVGSVAARLRRHALLSCDSSGRHDPIDPAPKGR